MHNLVRVLTFFVTLLGASTARATDEPNCGKPIFFADSVTEVWLVQFSELIRDCLGTEGHRTTVHITTQGGNAGVASAIYDLVNLADGKENLTAIATGYVQSAGVIILLSAPKRKITCNGSLLIHPIKVDARYQRLTIGDIQDLAREIQLHHDAYVRIFADTTKLTPAEADRMLKEETVLSAEDALRLGFVHEIIGCRGPRAAAPR